LSASGIAVPANGDWQAIGTGTANAPRVNRLAASMPPPRPFAPPPTAAVPVPSARGLAELWNEQEWRETELAELVHAIADGIAMAWQVR